MPQYFPPHPGGNVTSLNVTATTVIKSAPGRIYTVSVVVAGSAAGGVYDNSATSGNVAANQVGVIPQAIGTYQFYGMPTATGIVIVPPTGATLSVSWA
ncbi:hypothetical protein P4G95_09135 [Burkholderia vietnamiensis]|uniref:hypothetical protein n=1 Tax=Burkholderia vietnamiensis TaxID=60552 RepID=UPI0015932886|nr:hypothetical protein [Burkholderia vietnamiensis]WHU91042.1 hypothetical protein P4G95_09135 [Burkholderia vietnamiensis]